MRLAVRFCGLLVLILVASEVSAQNSSANLLGPYFGQTLPGAVPVLFAPGIVSARGSLETSVAVGPDGREIYFTRGSRSGNRVMVSRLTVSGWTEPEEAPFSRGYDSMEPAFAADGRRLYFVSERPAPGSRGPEPRTWVVERTAAGGWSEPRFHGSVMSVSSTRSGNLYALSFRGPRGLVVVPRMASGEYGTPRPVLEAAASRCGGGHPAVAPDESYILSEVRQPDGRERYALQACFRRPDGTWSAPQYLGDVLDTPGGQWIPTISADGSFIFFTCGEDDVYWVSARVLDGSRARALAQPGSR